MKRKLFYGWIVALAGMCVMATAIGIINNCFGLLIIPACKELGLSRRAMAGNQTMLNLGAMITAIAAGKIFSHYRIRVLMRIGSVVMCVFYFLLSLVYSLPAFYIVALGTGLAQGMVNVVPFSIVIGNWFHKHRGLALGLTYMGSGLGGMLFNLLGGYLIERLNWRITVQIFAAILCAVVLPLIFLVVKVRPEDMGLRPLEEGERAAAHQRPVKAKLGEWLRQKTFYVVGLDIFVVGMAVNGIAATSTPYYTDLFSSTLVGANLASGFMASVAAGKLLLGVLYDRLGLLKATLVSHLLLMTALAALGMGRNSFFIGVFLLSTGIAAAMSSVSIPFLAGALASGVDRVEVVGAYSGLQSLGALMAPVACGWICDQTGDYALSYWLLLIAVGFILPICMISLLRLCRKMH